MLTYAPLTYYTTNHVSATMAINSVKGVFEIKAKCFAIIM